MSTNTQTKSWNLRTLFWELVVLLFMFGFRFLPPFGEMTQLGMEIAGIFIGAIIGWITIGMVFPNIAGIIALGFSSAYPDMITCFQSTFASDTVVMMLGCLFICAFIEATNLTHVIIGFLLNLKIAKTSIIAFFILFFLACWLVSALSSSILAVYLFIIMYREMTKKANIPPHTKLNSFMLCGIGLISVLGDISFPFKPTAVLILSVLESFTGEAFSFGFYLLYCTSFQFVLIILFVLLGRFVLRLDFSQIEQTEVEKVKPNIKQLIGLWCSFLMIVAFALSSTNLPVFSSLGLGGVSLVLLLIMVFIQVDGKPLLDPMELAGKFNWPIYLLMCFFMAIANFLGSDTTGITASFKELFSPILTAVPPFLFVIIALVLSTVLTNFLNNMPVAVIFISTMYALSDSMPSINLTAASLAIIMAAFAACATPAANPANALAFSNTDLIATGTSIKIGTICCGILCLICIVIYFPLLNFLLP